MVCCLREAEREREREREGGGGGGESGWEFWNGRGEEGVYLSSSDCQIDTLGLSALNAVRPGKRGGGGGGQIYSK